MEPWSVEQCLTVMESWMQHEDCMFHQLRRTMEALRLENGKLRAENEAIRCAHELPSGLPLLQFQAPTR